jgi:hypothetical protein
MKKTVGTIPKFLKASSPRGLQRLMLKTQLNLGYGVNWFDIQKDGKQWVVWYYDNEDITSLNVREKLGSDSERNEQG